MSGYQTPAARHFAAAEELLSNPKSTAADAAKALAHATLARVAVDHLHRDPTPAARRLLTDLTRLLGAEEERSPTPNPLVTDRSAEALRALDRMRKS